MSESNRLKYQDFLTLVNMGCHHSKSSNITGRAGLSLPCQDSSPKNEGTTSTTSAVNLGLIGGARSAKEAEARSKQIGRQLKKDFYANKDIVKLLLLG